MKHRRSSARPTSAPPRSRRRTAWAVETVEMLAEAAEGSPFVAAVNLPFRRGGPARGPSWMRLAETVGRFLGHAAGRPLRPSRSRSAGVPDASGRLRRRGDPRRPLPCTARREPRERAGLARLERRGRDRGGPGRRGEANASLVGVTVATKAGARSASGPLFDDGSGRIVEFRRLCRSSSPRRGTLLVITTGTSRRRWPIGTFLARRGSTSSTSTLRAARRPGRAVVRIDRPTAGRSSRPSPRRGGALGIESRARPSG